MTDASNTFTAMLVSLTALAAAARYDCPPAITVTVGLGASDSAVTTASAIETEASDYMTISVTNMYGTSLSLSLDSDAGGPSPVGNPSADIISSASSTRFTFPTGWAGRILVGPNLNINGSKIEGSFTGPPDIDVSYVDGFSVPLTCSSEGVVVSGCNLDLFEQGTCEDLVEGPVCLNPARFFPDGPPTAFFAACAGAAYTYPNDNEANVSNLGSKLVSCCIGTLCRAPLRQISQGVPLASTQNSTTARSSTRRLTFNSTFHAPPYPTNHKGSGTRDASLALTSLQLPSTGTPSRHHGTITKWATSTWWATSTRWVTLTSQVTNPVVSQM